MIMVLLAGSCLSCGMPYYKQRPFRGANYLHSCDCHGPAKARLSLQKPILITKFEKGKQNES